MESFNFHLPTKITFGVDSLQCLGDVVCCYGKKALIVTGRRAMRASGVLSWVEQLLAEIATFNASLLVGSDKTDTKEICMVMNMLI
ncbi:MAG: hypothetical protein DRO46_02085 [Candidatus Hecatellales archaeon]|nr:MAG: hypothetical protein DRO46_02085 [Candidatus Hecatellales archaeon]